MRARDAWTAFIKHRGDVAIVHPRHKYGAHKVLLDGIAFDSKREAARYAELKMMIKAGMIADLEIHPGYSLQVVELFRSGPPWVIAMIGLFHADFRYIDLRSGECIVEDVKSKPTKTEAYQLRKKIVEAVHGITIREIE